jgi:hypothetical protein
MLRVLALAGAAVVALATPEAARAGVTYSGQATALSASATLPLGSVAATAGDTGALPPGGGSLSCSVLSASVPGLLSTGVLSGQTQGSGGVASSQSAVANLNVSAAGVVNLTATLIQSQTQASAVGGPGAITVSGSSVLTDLHVSVLGIPISVNVTGAPNQVIDLAVHVPLLGTIDVGDLIINEQSSTVTPTHGEITVNALHLELNGFNAVTADVVLAHSHSDVDITAGPTAVPEPSTALLLAAGAGGAGLLRLARRRGLARSTPAA